MRLLLPAIKALYKIDFLFDTSRRQVPQFIPSCNQNLSSSSTERCIITGINQDVFHIPTPEDLHLCMDDDPNGGAVLLHLCKVLLNLLFTQVIGPLGAGLGECLLL